MPISATLGLGTSSSIRDWASRPSSCLPDYNKGHAWGSTRAVWAEASTPQTTSFPGRLTKVRTLKVTSRVRRQVSRLTLGLTVEDR